MADDAAAPEGELSESASEPEETAAAPVDEDADADEPSSTDADEPSQAGTSPVLVALVAGLVAVLAMTGLCGWLGFRFYQERAEQTLRQEFLQVGRQGAVNLTTIDFEQVDSDVQRILDSATGGFYDEFSQRSQPFAEVVKQVKSKSSGTVTEAGLESVTGDEAVVLVAVTVNTSMVDQPPQPPRYWRMRVTVQRIDGGDVKVSNVGFVQ